MNERLRETFIPVASLAVIALLAVVCWRTGRAILRGVAEIYTTASPVGQAALPVSVSVVVVVWLLTRHR